MSKKSLLSGRDKELQEMAEQYEASLAEGKSIYLDADDFADLADWYARHNLSEMAFKVVEQGLLLHPDDTDLLTEQAYLYLDTFQIDKARQTANRITEPNDAVRILRAELLLNEGKEKEAELQLEALEAPNDIDNIVDVGYLYLDMNKADKVAEWMQKTSPQDQEDFRLLGLSADYLYSLKQYAQAAEQYNKLIDINPYSASYWLGLARCYFATEQYDKTIEACDFAIISDEEFGEPYILKGHSFSELGNEEAAIENYRLAEQYHAAPQGYTSSYCGLQCITREEWDKAFLYFEQVLNGQNAGMQQATLSTIYANAALCLYKMGQHEATNEYIRKAHETYEDNPELYLIEGYLHALEHEYERAIELWNTALDIAPDADTWEEIALYCMESGMYTNASQSLKKILTLDPQRPETEERLTLVCLLLGKNDEAYLHNSRTKRPLKEQDLERIRLMLEDIPDEERLKALKAFIKNLDY